jgi:TetR/AcrR family acrAB operon transcriptional repressor
MRRTKAEAAETRANIIAAAERLFYDKGIPETSLEDIAREAGVTRGAIYWHFANKTEVLLVLQDEVPLPQEDMFLKELQSDPPDPLALIQRTSLEWLDLISRDERRQRIYSILLRCDYSPEMAGVLEREREADAVHCDVLVTAFEQAQANGQLSGRWTAETAARTFMWVLKGLYGDWLRFGMKFDLVTEARNSLEGLFACFRSDGKKYK